MSAAPAVLGGCNALNAGGRPSCHECCDHPSTSGGAGHNSHTVAVDLSAFVGPNPKHAAGTAQQALSSYECRVCGIDECDTDCLIATGAAVTGAGVPSKSADSGESCANAAIQPESVRGQSVHINENIRTVAAVGDPPVNDDVFLDDYLSDLENAAPELGPQDEAPSVPIRTEKPKRHPGNPTKEKMDAHNLTHANYRSWCAICNRAALK